jgi:multisubunit Na+/H+ antiporter MnhE subunit
LPGVYHYRLMGLLLLAAVSSKGRQALPWRVLAFLRFVVIFTKELVVANVMIALLALKPRPVFYPHVIAVPLRLKSDGAIAMLSGEGYPVHFGWVNPT